jgi:molybdopterin-containing oxidoreductase family iron-sulfur binding subunit
MSDEQTVNPSRRHFVGSAVAVAGITIAPGVFLTRVAHAESASQAATEKNRWGMLIDSSKCATGCNDCVTACNKENGISGFNREKTDAQWIRKVTLKDKTTGYVQSLPLLCQHCKNPPCVDVCPTGASMKRADGIVLVDKHICIGCRYCMMACPFKARSFIHEVLEEQKAIAPRGKGTVESCTLCVHRVDANRAEADPAKHKDPACVEACTTKEHRAMWFGDLNDENSEIRKQLKAHGGQQIRADLKLDTGVRYQGIN